MASLFDPARRFRGLPVDGFEVFGISNHGERRKRIIEAFHPALELLAEDLRARLAPPGTLPLYTHLPRLDWPRGYKPFCTWLVLSHESHGYLARAQLNLGVHADYVALRLGWDTTHEQFGRFEFLCRNAGLGEELGSIAAQEQLTFRVYAAADWPRGSREVYTSRDDWKESFAANREIGVWWELGVHYELAAEAPLIGSERLGQEAARVFGAVLPVLDRL